MKQVAGTMGAAFALVLLAGCQSGPAQDSPEHAPALRVLQVSAAELGATAHGPEEPGLAEACRDWQLSPAQVERFFTLAERYADGTGLHQRFYFLPCRITGQLESHGRRWDFAINAAATASWQNEEEVRQFGCSAPECEALVLLMPDNGDDAE